MSIFRDEIINRKIADSPKKEFEVDVTFITDKVAYIVNKTLNKSLEGIIKGKCFDLIANIFIEVVDVTK